MTGGPVTGNEAALRALHLEPYRAAVKARVGSVMLSYNLWQGTEMHINKAMVTDVLKGELGFGGFVVTDYNGCSQVGLNPTDGIAACLNAGADMFMIFGGGSGTPQPIGSGTTVQTTITRAGDGQQGSGGAARRRGSPHPGGEVRDGPVRQRRGDRSGGDEPGRIGRAPDAGAARGAAVAGRAEERR